MEQTKYSTSFGLNNKNQLLSLGLLFTSILLLLLNYIYYFYGHFGYDDLHYARLAANLLEGNIDWNDHYSYRFTITSLTATAYALFGINDFASMLPAMSLSIGILITLYSFTHKQAFYLFIAIVLYFSFKWNVFYADKLMPDIYVSAFLFFTWAAYVHYHQTTNNKIKAYLPFLFALSLFLAFHSKGTLILCLPLFAYYFCKDWIQKGWTLFWKKTIAWGALLFGAYFLGIFWKTGHPLTRFKAITTNQYFNECSYDQRGWDVLWQRLTSDFFHMMSSELLLIPLLIGLIALIISFFNQKWASIRFYAYSLIILYLSANMMTISLSSYNPICLDARHLLYMSPIAAICATMILQTLLSSLPKNYQYLTYGLLLLASFFLLRPTYQQALYGRTLHYPEVKKELQSIITQNQNGGQFYGSTVFKNMGEYLSTFDANAPVQFYDLQNIKQISPTKTKAILVRNWYTEWHANLSQQTIDQFLKIHGFRLQKIENKEGLVYFELYEMKEESGRED